MRLNPLLKLILSRDGIMVQEDTISSIGTRALLDYQIERGAMGYWIRPGKDYPNPVHISPAWTSPVGDMAMCPDIATIEANIRRLLTRASVDSEPGRVLLAIGAGVVLTTRILADATPHTRAHLPYLGNLLGILNVP